MTKKEIASDFLELTAKGHSLKAFEQYAGSNFKHHNAYFKGDATSLMTAMQESARQNPESVFQILRVLEDGNMVTAHSRYRQKPNSPDVAVIHIFEFDGDRIIELWDFGQAVPDNMVNENGMF
ncbi:MAG TPA: nuclear transport factor 2 family protein [Bacteroidia bacterium]|nr:nuclear transport factor 2 family protein [Bacteroidia bacterium]